MVNPKIN